MMTDDDECTSDSGSSYYSCKLKKYIGPDTTIYAADGAVHATEGVIHEANRAKGNTAHEANSAKGNTTHETDPAKDIIHAAEGDQNTP
jgi:hypothetical protein